MLSWLCLAGAAVGNAAGTYALERSDRLRRRGPAALAVVGYLAAVGLFTQALEGIPTSVADAAFAAVGTALITLVGVVLLGERLDARRVLGLGLVVVGVVLLQLPPS